MNASRTSCFSIELARIRISNALTFAQHCFKLRSAAGGYQSAEDRLAFTNSDAAAFGNIAAVWNSSSGDLELTSQGGTATVAQWRAALRAVTYTNSSDSSNATDRVVSFVVSDGTGSSLAASRTVTVTTVNDTPTLTTSGGSAAWTEGNNTPSTPVVVDPGITLGDLDSAGLTTATIRISGNLVSGEDVLAFANASGMGNIAVESWTASTGTLVLTSAGATATPAEWAAALRAVTYANSSDSPDTASRTVSFTVSDGTSTSTVGTRTVTLAATNDAPTIAGGSSTAIDDTATATPFSGVTIGDLDGPVTVTISLDDAAKGAFSTLNGFSAANGVYTFSGTAAEATAAIQGMVFTPAQNRVVVGATETTNFTISVNDGIVTTPTTDSATQVTVTSINDAPVIGGTAATTTITDTATPTPFSGLTFSDADLGGTFTVAISYTAANGTLGGTRLSGSAGSYALSGASAAELTGRLQALV